MEKAIDETFKEDINTAIQLEGACTFWVPVGDITVIAPWSGERNDFRRKAFTYDFVKNDLTWLETKGLVRVTGMGSHRTVTPTDLAKRESDRGLAARAASDGFTGILLIPRGHCEVMRIISSSPYKSQQLSSSEEYRLVVGTYRITYSTFYRTLLPERGSGGERKFRVVMQRNPFMNRWKLIAMDYGDIEKHEWETHNVE